MKVSLEKARWMEEEFLHQLMAMHTKVNLEMVLSMVKVNSLVEMAFLTMRGLGLTTKEMARKVSMLTKMEIDTMDLLSQTKNMERKAIYYMQMVANSREIGEMTNLRKALLFEMMELTFKVIGEKTD